MIEGAVCNADGFFYVAWTRTSNYIRILIFICLVQDVDLLHQNISIFIWKYSSNFDVHFV